jgi:hypothetical protein
VNMSLTVPRGSLVFKTCPGRWSNTAREVTGAGAVLTAVAVVIAIPSDTESSTMSVARTGTGPATCTSCIPNTAARPVAFTSARTCPTSRPPAAITPSASSPWPCVWWPKMACPIEPPPGISGAITASSFPSLPSKTGWRLREKKTAAQLDTDYLDWALTDFSGYLAADELYDGPFCVLSAVDARQQRRLLYEVLDHNPTQVDLLFFLARLYDHLRARGLTVAGITTDASPLYPLPLALVFRNVPHQICEFHILKELTKAVLRVLAHLRKQLAAQTPPSPRGRPKNTLEDQQRHRQAQAISQRVADLFEHRHLFVRHHLTASQHAILQRLVRYGQPLRALRAIMDEVYRLFDRRCSTDTALAKLARLRQRVRRYRSLGKSLDKLHSPNLEKALTFLDDALLPSTSNAVERGNRRHRKMQKAIYRVRTQATLVGRLALDLQRDQQADSRSSTIGCLHQARE